MENFFVWRKDFLNLIGNYISEEGEMNIESLKVGIIDSHQMISRIMNVECRKLLFGIGKCLYENKVTIDFLYEQLYEEYGNTIIFSKRSLHYCKLFYEKYHKIIMLVPLNMTWNQIVVLLEKKYTLGQDIEIFKTITFFSLNEREISYYLTTGKIMFLESDKCVNNIVFEFMNL